MEPAILIAVLTSVFLGAVMVLAPHISPRRYLFAITVTPEFRTSDTARAALGRYYAWESSAIVLACVVAIALERTPGLAIVLAPWLPVVVGLGEFLRERARIRAYAAPAPEAAAAARRPPADGALPRWVALAAVPFAFPLAAALYLRAHWNEIPARYPIHWGINGQPNGWAEKTVRGVYGPLLFAAGLMLLMLMMGLAVYYGSRRGPLRRPVLAMMIAVMYMLGLVFAAVGLMPLIYIPPAAFMIPVFVLMVVVLVWSYRVARANQPEEVTPDECWKLGGIYYNRSDPALFVQRRFGVGYTFNFGNRLSWVILAAFLGGIAALVLVLPRG